VKFTDEMPESVSGETSSHFPDELPRVSPWIPRESVLLLLQAKESDRSVGSIIIIVKSSEVSI
jgi:hypothetical protein